MLAHTYNPDKHNVDGYWWSIKKDGVRGCWDGNKMLSRNGNEFTIPAFIKEQLEKINIPVEGEIWFGIDTFDIASGAARRNFNDDEIWKNMKFIIFDTPDEKNIFEERINNIKKAIKKAGHLPNIELIEYKKFDKTLTTIDKLLKEVEDLGEEGLILRKPASLYVFKRSHDMLKVKSWIYKECEVVGYIEGTGRLEGLVGSLEVKCGDLDEGGEGFVSFKIGSGLNDDQRFSGSPDDSWKKKTTQKFINDARKNIRKNVSVDDKLVKLLANKIRHSKGQEKINTIHQLNELLPCVPIIGSIVTFRYKELTKNGVPKFPTFIGVRDYE
jgi:DNA ligase-1